MPAGRPPVRIRPWARPLLSGAPLPLRSPCCLFAAYTDELGAVGGTCLEEEASALRLEEDSEHPPMILRTD